MKECLQQLDCAIALAEQEYKALREEDIGVVENLAEKRGRLLNSALLNAAEVPKRELCDRLIRLQGLQQKLFDEAFRQRESVRQQLAHTKKESRRMSAYHQNQYISMP